MGNCHVTDAGAVVIHHPGGHVERLYWPTSAGEIMRSHPGHYVTLVNFYISRESSSDSLKMASLKMPSLKMASLRLLRHKDILLVGQVYRLVSSQDVTKALEARKQEKMKKDVAELIKQQKHRERLQNSKTVEEKAAQERQKNSSRYWRPSLQSISEIGS